MKFTPAQARAIADVSEQTLRYWKRHLVPLKDKRGHGPSYTHGELLALMVTNVLVRDLTIDVRCISDHAEQLFAICHQNQWLKNRDGVLRISSTEIDVHPAPRQIESTITNGPCILVPLGPIIEKLQSNLINQDPDAQLELSWPPLGLAALKEVAQ